MNGEIFILIKRMVINAGVNNEIIVVFKVGDVHYMRIYLINIKIG